LQAGFRLWPGKTRLGLNRRQVNQENIAGPGGRNVLRTDIAFCKIGDKVSRKSVQNITVPPARSVGMLRYQANCVEILISDKIRKTSYKESRIKQNNFLYSSLTIEDSS